MIDEFEAVRRRLRGRPPRNVGSSPTGGQSGSRMFGVLQLSDIHFAYERESLFDVDRELRDALLAFLPEMVDRRGSIDLIGVGGDGAYHGLEREYEWAHGFLRVLRSRLDRPAMPVRVIPGNHDIFREATLTADQ